jgi:hypothetical protein
LLVFYPFSVFCGQSNPIKALLNNACNGNWWKFGKMIGGEEGMRGLII